MLDLVVANCKLFIEYSSNREVFVPVRYDAEAYSACVPKY